MEEPKDVTRLLIERSAWDKLVLEGLFPLVGGELRLIARRCFRGERRAVTLQKATLVHEPYLNFTDQNRPCFCGAANQAMRRVRLGSGTINTACDGAANDRGFNFAAADGRLEQVRESRNFHEVIDRAFKCQRPIVSVSGYCPDVFDPLPVH